MLIHTLVDGSAPDGGIVGDSLPDHIQAIGCSDDAGYVDASRFAVVQQSLVGSRHGSARSEHGVSDDERLVLGAGCRHVLSVYAHFGVFAVGVHAIGRDEGVVGMVEDVQESLVEGQSGPQHGGDDDVVLGQGDVDATERSGDVLRLVFERFGQFVCHHLPDAPDVVSEEHSVLLILPVSNL